MESVERLQWTLHSGGLLWDAVQGRYSESFPKNPHEVHQQPPYHRRHSRSGSGRPGSWVGPLFDYQPPRLGFNRSEQRLILAALASESGTDQKLAETLGVSLPAIKKTWLSVYRRVACRQPEIIPDAAGVDSGVHDRGKEKRRRLLAYLRVHFEELRPASQRLLGQPAAIGNEGTSRAMPPARPAFSVNKT